MRGSDPRREGLLEQARDAIVEYEDDIRRKFPYLIAKTKREIQRLEQSIEEVLWPMTPTTERVDFFRNGQLVNPVMLSIQVRVDRLDGATH